jgi:hypothetical protein
MIEGSGSRAGSGSIPLTSGSGSGGFGSGSATLLSVRKTLIPAALWLLLDFFFLENYEKVPSKSKKQKNLKYKLIFL